MIKEAIILAGGLGTRLRSVVSELPKCMAPVAGKPFLDYVINYLEKEGIKNLFFLWDIKMKLFKNISWKDYQPKIIIFQLKQIHWEQAALLSLPAQKLLKKQYLL